MPIIAMHVLIIIIPIPDGNFNKENLVKCIEFCHCIALRMQIAWQIISSEF